MVGNPRYRHRTQKHQQRNENKGEITPCVRILDMLGALARIRPDCRALSPKAVHSVLLIADANAFCLEGLLSGQSRFPWFLAFFLLDVGPHGLIGLPSCGGGVS